MAASALEQCWNRVGTAMDRSQIKAGTKLDLGQAWNNWSHAWTEFQRSGKNAWNSTVTALERRENEDGTMLKQRANSARTLSKGQKSQKCTGNDNTRHVSDIVK
jgi:hypothetical protein